MTDDPGMKKLTPSFQVNLALACLSIVFYSILSYALLLGVLHLDYLMGNETDFFSYAILLLWAIWVVASALAIFIVSWRRPANFLGVAFVLSGVLLVAPIF
ncbi:MAG: hypothetical protein ABL918_01890 [Chakrabartia sp.]